MFWLCLVASPMFWLGFAIVFCGGFCQTDIDEDQMTCETGTCAIKGQVMLQTHSKKTVDETSTKASLSMECPAFSVSFQGNCYATRAYASPHSTDTKTSESASCKIEHGWEFANYSDELAEFLAQYPWGTYGLYLKNPEDPALCVQTCSLNLLNYGAQNCRTSNPYGFKNIYQHRASDSCIASVSSPRLIEVGRGDMAGSWDEEGSNQYGGYHYTWAYYDSDSTSWGYPGDWYKYAYKVNNPEGHHYVRGIVDETVYRTPRGNSVMIIMCHPTEFFSCDEDDMEDSWYDRVMTCNDER